MKRMVSRFLPLALLLGGIGQAKADVITGSIYQNTAQASNADGTIPAGPNATFSVNGALNYNIQQQNSNFTVENFLNDAKITPNASFTPNAPFSTPNNLVTGTYLLFFGTTTLGTGTSTYTFTHDDGATLEVFKGGTLVGETSSPGPTSARYLHAHPDGPHCRDIHLHPRLRRSQRGPGRPQP